MLYPKTNRVMLIDCSSIKKYLMDSYKHKRKSRRKKQQNESGKFLTIEEPIKKLLKMTEARLTLLIIASERTNYSKQSN